MPAGGNSRFRGYPARMSERQQLALLLQMTSQEIVPSGAARPETLASQSTSRSSSLTHPRGSKSRWSTKNAESPTHRKEDYPRRSMIFNGYEQIGKEPHEATGANQSEETSSPDSPHSPSSEAGSGAPPIVRKDQHDNQGYQHSKVYQYQRPTGTTSAGTQQDAEDSGDLCEMRRTPPQNKVDRSGSGTGSSPRVTLRLNQVRGVRDDKKSAGSSSRQSMSANQGQMETAKSTPSTAQGSSSSTTTTTTTGAPSTPSGVAASGGAPAVDTSDVYEFKSSKEATPVRGASSSPNPPDKEKETSKTSGGTSQAEAQPSASESTPVAAGGSGAAEGTAVGSPSAKRAYEGNEEEQDEENRRKKRKESEGSKDTKGTTSGRASTGRAAAGASDKSDKLASVVTASSIVEQCPKAGKQVAAPAGKPTPSSSTASDRKSPSSISASSPKPQPTPPTKTSTPAPESDSEEDRPKSSDSSSAPKVPPLKIVIPQTTEQEQTRNGKNPSTRGHQLPYVVASSNSNDSTDKDQAQSTSGTTSPTEAPVTSKPEEKKDFTGAIHNEERSTHHQRVLRSSHRGNGNGSSNSKDSSSNQSGNGNYSNSSPLPAADRSNNSSPQPTAPEGPSEPVKTTSEPVPSTPKTTSNSEKTEKSEGNGKKETSESSENSSGSSSANTSTTTAPPVELHPRKRKMKPNKEAQQAVAASNEASETANTGTEVHPHDQPITNCYQLFLNIRKQIERRRKGLFPVQPKPPQGFKDYLMNRCTYVLAGNANKEPNVNPPGSLQGPMKELYVEQEKERYRLRMQHVVEKEKLVLSVEQEILRVHGRAARALANQILPFSVCTILKDEEVYNVITPEQEEKDRNQRSRYNGRLFLSWLQDVDDKWEKIKEAMLLRHHNEAESLHAVQRMDWEWKLKEVGLCEFKATPQIDDLHVPIVHVSDDFDLLPA